MSSKAEEFRKHADECRRLSAQLQKPEHKSLALYIADAWLKLAQEAERRRDRTQSGTSADHDPAGPPAA